MIGVLSGFAQQIAIPNIFGTRREALTAPCPERGWIAERDPELRKQPMQSRNGPHTIRACAPHHDVIRTRLISDCIERSPCPGSECYWKATHGEDCAIVLCTFARVDDAHPSRALS